MQTIKCTWVILRVHVTLAGDLWLDDEPACHPTFVLVLWATCCCFSFACPKENRLTLWHHLLSALRACGAQHSLIQTTFFVLHCFQSTNSPDTCTRDALRTALPNKPKSELFLCKPMEKNPFHFSHKEAAHSFICAKAKKRKNS